MIMHCFHSNLCDEWTDLMCNCCTVPLRNDSVRGKRRAEKRREGWAVIRKTSNGWEEHGGTNDCIDSITLHFNPIFPVTD